MAFQPVEYVAFLDLDGLLASNTHRLHHMYNKDYDKFYSYEEVIQDTIIPRGRMLTKTLGNAFSIVFVTGRNETCRKATEDWIQSVGVNHDAILMRPADDHREAYELKPELIKTYLDNSEHVVPILFIDDEIRNVDAVNKLFPGLACLTFNKFY